MQNYAKKLASRKLRWEDYRVKAALVFLAVACIVAAVCGKWTAALLCGVDVGFFFGLWCWLNGRNVTVQQVAARPSFSTRID